MKKTLLALAVTLAVVATSSAQGIVLFSNSGGSRVSTNAVVGGSAVSGGYAAGTFYYALFASQTQTTVGGSTAPVVGQGTYAFNSAGWTFQAYATNSTAGRLASSQLDSAGNTALTFAGGSSAYFTIVAWSANIGSTWDAVQSYLANPTFAAFVGESAVSGALTPGIEGSTGATPLFGAAPNIPGFTAGLVNAAATPEPTTMALAGLGIASLLALRRKK